MPANTSPIFVLTPNNGADSTQLINAVGSPNQYNGIDVNVVLIFTAGANGAYVERVRAVAGGTNGTASVLRIWRNNSSSVGTAANNNLIGELTLPTTAASQTAATTPQELALGFALEANYKLYAGLGTAGGSGVGWYIQVYGGNY